MTNQDILKQLIEQQNLIQWTLNNKHTEQISFTLHEFTISWLADGILELQPASSTDTDLILSCGVHGNETAPIEMVEDLLRQLLTGSLDLNCRLLIILGNLAAMKINKRFIEENMNRLFSHNHLESQAMEASRTATIEQCVTQFFNREGVKRIHLDLHTAIRGSIVEKFAIYPYPNSKAWSEQQLNWLAKSGIQAVLLGHQPSGTFSYYTSASFDAMAFTIELGKALPFGENDHSRLTQFKNEVSKLINATTDWTFDSDTNELAIYRVVDEVLRHSEDAFELHLADDFLNFTSLTQGFQLTSDSPADYLIKEEGHAIVFPNKNVPVGQRVALVIEPCDREQIQ